MKAFEEEVKLASLLTNNSNDPDKKK